MASWKKPNVIVFNHKISTVRYKVEQAFGTLKRRFGFRQASYLGTVKVQSQMILKSIAFNLKKAFNKINRLYLTPQLPL
jgi:IS5 family transposase